MEAMDSRQATAKRAVFIGYLRYRYSCVACGRRLAHAVPIKEAPAFRGCPRGEKYGYRVPVPSPFAMVKMVSGVEAGRGSHGGPPVQVGGTNVPPGKRPSAHIVTQWL